MKLTSVVITPESRAQFTNNAAFCVGTGRMGLALHREYLDQLAMAQVSISAYKPTPEYGYDYEWYEQHV